VPLVFVSEACRKCRLCKSGVPVGPCRHTRRARSDYTCSLLSPCASAFAVRPSCSSHKLPVPLIRLLPLRLPLILASSHSQTDADARCSATHTHRARTVAAKLAHTLYASVRSTHLQGTSPRPTAGQRIIISSCRTSTSRCLPSHMHHLSHDITVAALPAAAVSISGAPSAAGCWFFLNLCIFMFMPAERITSMSGISPLGPN